MKGIKIRLFPSYLFYIPSLGFFPSFLYLCTCLLRGFVLVAISAPSLLLAVVNTVGHINIVLRSDSDPDSLQRGSHVCLQLE